MPEQPPITVLLTLTDLEAFKAAVLPFVPPEDKELLASLHRTDDGGLAVTWHGLQVRVGVSSGPAG